MQSKPQAAGAEVALLDVERIRMLIAMDEGNPEPMYRELLGIFAEQTAAILDALDEAQRARDVERCAREAHRLKGSASNLGMTAVAARCAALQRMCVSGKGRGAEADDISDLRVLCHDSLAAARALAG